MVAEPTPAMGNEPPDLSSLCLAITEHAPLPMATVEGASHIVSYVNPAFCRLMDKPTKQLVGKPFREMLPEKDKCVTLLDRVFRTGKPESHTEQQHSKPHSVFWSYTVWPVIADERPVGVMIQVTETAKFHEQTVAMNEALMLGSLRQHELTEAAENLNAQLQTEITERKRAEDKVRVSEVRYRRLFEAAHNGVLLLDPGTRKITDANPFMTKLLGYPHAQLIGKELFEIGLIKDEAASQEMFRKLKKKREVRYEDLPLESQGGRHQEVEVVANLYQENGHSVIQCNIRDITERKQAEEMLRRNEALFSALIQQAPLGVYVVDGQLRMQQVNPRAQPVFSKIHPLSGRDFSEIIHIIWPEKIADEIMEHFRHTLKTGKPYYSPEFSERRRDIGVTQAYEWQIQRITLPAGHHGVVCFFNDITERKQVEATQRRIEVLAASNRKLEKEIVQRQAVEEALRKSEQHQSGLLEKSRQMHEQLRHLSHQILSAQEEERKRISRELHDQVAQTLTGINVQLAALKAGAAVNTKGIQKKIASTQRQVERSVDIVHRFARELRPSVLDDLGLIPALHSYMKDFTKRMGIRIDFTAVADVEKLNSAKRTVLYRVAQAALTNAAQHAQAGRVEVSMQKYRGTVRMDIRDDGKGFEVASVLFAKKNKRLGLLGMRERVEMVGGNFHITSVPGKGTTIRAQIPFNNGNKA